ncbi:MAG: hypothetical protein M1834_006565 [Cirrosporium novae-zelandiae]|nr:MAG: hypothetical protein M1834_006565 [Cirrosporium novae-zelandiae]
MPPQPPRNQPAPPPTGGKWNVLKAAELLILPAIYASLSQLNLSPVYGSIPASLFHQHGILGTSLIVWVFKPQLQSIIPKNIIYFLPVLAFWIPTLQFFLFKISGNLGATYGPLITEILTIYPLAIFSVHFAASFLDRLDLHRFNKHIAEAAPGILSYFLFSITEKTASTAIPMYLGKNLLVTRARLELAISTLYAVSLPSNWLVYVIPSLLFSTTYNTHMPMQHTTAKLNETLHSYDYSLLARNESVTGYISVLENLKDGFRVMRCDHSLLGGEWIATQKDHVGRVNEPIYAVFAMLEAVRLVEISGVSYQKSVDTDKHALVIGLGIGTTPGALIAHGINTTIVEIDPVVYQYALDYFSLPLNHTAVIRDAASVVLEAQATKDTRRYDYIIHDVFTGGAEPVTLFTQEFIAGLRYLLKRNGVVAINYAGDLLLPSASIVVKTITSVFPTCRIFRESAASEDKNLVHDFTNLVIFCTNSRKRFSFRLPGPDDFLGSGARQAFLLPRYEVPLSKFNLNELSDSDILRMDHTYHLASSQMYSAVGHWNLMRTVLPSSIWENW